MRTAFVASVAFIGATLCVAGAMQQSEIAFVDVTVIPMDSERVLDHHTVVVNKGRIVSVGPVEQVPVAHQFNAYIRRRVR